ncbi:MULTISPECIES: hypothetical protein [unclassified Sphingomonas]|jgi:hypothetical protein|uniref:hypothetical protein n=1 Tax=unclassified Sphingomonas TaxID=196159 RepID=UPI000835B617|nr:MULTISPECIES: hypothetical protein [unclassified Sphingomonas]
MSEYIELFEDKSQDVNQAALNADEISEAIAQDVPVTGDELRIEETIARGWRGVRSCGDPARHKAELEAAMSGWVSAKLLEYVNLRVLRYGHGEVDIRWRNGRKPFPSNARWCTGSLTTRAYIVFAA